MSSWNHGGDPTEFIQINRNVDRFKVCWMLPFLRSLYIQIFKKLTRRFRFFVFFQESIKAERFLQDKVAEKFLENSHRLYMTMSPDVSLL